MYAVHIATEGNSGIRGPERESVEIAGEVSPSISRKQISFVSRGTEGKTGGRIGGMVEPVFVEREEVVSVDYYPIGNPKFLRGIEIVGDVPAAHINIEVGGVKQFDGIDRGAIGVADDFIDQNRIHRQREWIGQSRGATWVSAGLPVRLLPPGIPGGIFVHDLQREAEAIGDWIPTIVIREIEDLF